MMTSIILNTAESNWLDRTKLPRRTLIIRLYIYTCMNKQLMNKKSQFHQLLLLPASLFGKSPQEAQFWKNSSLWCHQGNRYLLQCSDSLPAVCFYATAWDDWRLPFTQVENQQQEMKKIDSAGSKNKTPKYSIVFFWMINCVWQHY